MSNLILRLGAVVQIFGGVTVLVTSRPLDTNALIVGGVLILAGIYFLWLY